MSKESNIRLINLFNWAKNNSEANKMLQEIFERHEPDPNTIEELVLEIRKDGSNTIGWILFDPVDYDEVAKDAAKKIGVDSKLIASKSDEIGYEQLVLEIAIKKYYDGLSEEEKESMNKEIMEKIGDDAQEIGKLFAEGMVFAGGVFALIIQQIGPRIFAQIMMKILPVIVGKAIGIAGIAALSRLPGILIPWLNVPLGIWLFFDIASPAYRKIVPTVLNIAIIRMQKIAEEEDD